MSFIVIERDRGEGTIRLPLDRSFATREAALEALSQAIADGGATVDGDLVVVDLDVGAPVLLLAQPAVPASEAAGVAPAEVAVEPAPSVPTDDGPVSGEVYAAWAEAAIADADEEETLAAVLKRAATSLESEGIVAPASIEAEPIAAVREPAGVEGVAAEVEPAASTSEADAAADQPGEENWPWANISEFADAETSADVPADPSEPAAVQAEAADMVAQAIASLDDPGPDVATLITGTPGEGEDAYLPKPVIMGDYAEVDAPAAQDAPEAATTPVEEVAMSEPPAAEPTEAVPSVELGYELGGELDLSSYTCDDCVYANTCPKVGQSAPVDCGSFQWRSE